MSLGVRQQRAREITEAKYLQFKTFTIDYLLFEASIAYQN